MVTKTTDYAAFLSALLWAALGVALLTWAIVRFAKPLIDFVGQLLTLIRWRSRLERVQQTRIRLFFEDDKLLKEHWLFQEIMSWDARHSRGGSKQFSSLAERIYVHTKELVTTGRTLHSKNHNTLDNLPNMSWFLPESTVMFGIERQAKSVLDQPTQDVRLFLYLTKDLHAQDVVALIAMDVFTDLHPGKASAFLSDDRANPGLDARRSDASSMMSGSPGLIRAGELASAGAERTLDELQRTRAVIDIFWHRAVALWIAWFVAQAAAELVTNVPSGVVQTAALLGGLLAVAAESLGKSLVERWNR